MCKDNVIEKCIGQQIQWISGSDPTKQKKRKGKGKKKSTVLVKADSFFNFFETVDAEKNDEAGKDEDSDDADEGKESDAKLDSDDNDPQAEQMEKDFDLGSTIRDDLIPQALEYFLGVVDDSSEDSEGDWGEDDDEIENAEDEDGKKKDKEPKSQECKQQ